MVPTLQLLQQEGLSAAPLGIEPHTDGRLHGWFAQDIGQSRAVQVITQHVSVRLRRGQVTCGQERTWCQRCRHGTPWTRDAMDTGRQLRTCSEDLREDAFLVAAVNVVRRFSGLVRAVQQAAIFGVPEEELGQAPAPPTDGDVKRCVSLLHKQEMRSFSSDCTEDN